MPHHTLIAVALFAVSIHANARRLVWSDPNPVGAVEYFNAYQSPVMPARWEYIGSVEGTEIAVDDRAPQMFFTVTAVDSVGEYPPIVSVQAVVVPKSTFTKLLPPKLR